MLILKMADLEGMQPLIEKFFPKHSNLKEFSKTRGMR